MEAKTEASLMRIIDLMVDEPEGYLFISAKKLDGGAIHYTYVLSDTLHADHLVSRAADLTLVQYEESPDDL